MSNWILIENIDDYSRLMSVYTDIGYMWVGGNKPHEYSGSFVKDPGDTLLIELANPFLRSYVKRHPGSEDSFITLQEALKMLKKEHGSIINKYLTPSTMTSVTEKFKLAFMKEPEKSFRKSGITNGDDFLTEDGVQVFLGWLLKKHGDDFKKEVVDDLLASDET